MTGPALASVLLALFGLGMITVLLVGLARNGLRLLKAVGAFVDESMPVIDEITAGLDRAAQHAERLATAASSIRSRD